MGELLYHIRMIIMNKIIIRITAKKSSSVIVSKQGSIISRLDYEGKYNSLPRHKKNKSIIQILVESDESENERRTRKDKNSTSQ